MVISAATAFILVVISGFTAFLSGLFGMAGGLILMGVFTWVMPVAFAMILHGIVQCVSNGYRAFLHRELILWSTMGYYIIGLMITLAIFQVAQIALGRPTLMILLGLTAFMAYVPKHIFMLDILKPTHATLCGFLNSILQLSVGVSGATLDIFFLNRKLTRHSVVATKAISQSLGHIAKLYYFGFALGDGVSMDDIFTNMPDWLLPGLLIMTVIGTFLSKSVLARMTDRAFHTWTRHVVAAIGVVYVIRGINLL